MPGEREYLENDGIMPLLREAIEGLGRLVADHIKLARVEMSADAREYGRHVGLLALAGLLVVLGYAFACLALTLALAHWMGAPLAFLAVGAVHVVAGAIGLRAIRARLKRPQVMNETVNEVGRSLSTIASRVSSTRATHAP